LIGLGRSVGQEVLATKESRFTRRELFGRTGLAVASWLVAPPLLEQSRAGTGIPMRDAPVGPLQSVQFIRQRREWRRFIILVWQWQNDVRRDRPLYDRAGLHGFHIDRGAGEDELVRYSLRYGFPYYVDHAAGKGILYLKKEDRSGITGKGSLLVRPHSLADPGTIASLTSQLRENVGTTRKGLVYAYAFDDEISSGSFNDPIEVDVHPRSVAWYRRWLALRYGSIANLNRVWGRAYVSFEEVQPVGFEEARRAASCANFSAWNLSPWMEWRHFMDYQFAQVLAELTRFTNALDPETPAGFVGGQQPSAYGGYDYALICRAVQWMEASDMGPTSEIVRSFWNRPRRVQAQTFGARTTFKKSVWVLWHRLAHGHQAAIAWPEGWMRETPPGPRDLAAAIRRLAPTFREVQGSAGELILDTESHLETDSIGLYYSHPSIRAGWAMDSAVHGAGWPKRSTSIDDRNLSSAHLRLSWQKLVEDLGYQYDFISYLDVQEGKVDLATRFKVIVLPQTICLAQREVQALHDFVKTGGTLIADALCGVLSETGRGGQAGALDDLFGVVRDEALGYLDGKGITEVDAEYNDQPMRRRLHAYDEALRFGPMIVFERGTRPAPPASGSPVKTAAVLIRKRSDMGKTLYLNLTPLAYHLFEVRSGETGRAWRALMAGVLRDAGLRPRVEIMGSNGAEPWMESLLWRRDHRYCLAVLKNLALSEGESELATIWGEEHDTEPREISIRLNLPVRDVRSARSGRRFGSGGAFQDWLKPWEANLYFFRRAD
jgi:Beta-galactosidase trimerisation domain